MAKHITRRIILGTILGGLVACPLIGYFVRKNKKNIASYSPLFDAREKLFDEWKSYYDKIIANSTNIEIGSHKNKGVSLFLDVSSPKMCHFIDLHTGINGPEASANCCTVENLVYFDITEGTITIDGNGLSTLTIEISRHERKSLSKQLFRPGSSSKFLLHSNGDSLENDLRNKDDLQIYDTGIEVTQLEMNRFKLVSFDGKLFPADDDGKLIGYKDIGKYGPAYMMAKTFCSKLRFPYLDRRISLNTTFEIKPNIPSGPTILPTILAEKIVRMKNYEAMKFYSERKMNTQQLTDFHRAHLKSMGVVEIAATKEIETIQKQHLTKWIKKSLYVDLVTGLTIFEEFCDGALADSRGLMSKSSIFQMT